VTGFSLAKQETPEEQLRGLLNDLAAYDPRRVISVAQMLHEKRIRRQFLSAAKRGDLAAARALLARGVDVNERLWRGADQAETALMLAVDAGHEEMARLLLQHGADVHIWTADEGMTSLMFAAAKGYAGAGAGGCGSLPPHLHGRPYALVGRKASVGQSYIRARRCASV
jgi:Ankyrin repeats (3 copies)